MSIDVSPVKCSDSEGFEAQCCHSRSLEIDLVPTGMELFGQNKPK